MFKSLLSLYILASLILLAGTTVLRAETISIASGEYPPWTSESLPNGGYINRLVKEAFALADIDVNFDYMPWKRALEATRLGKYHASAFWGENQDRNEDFLHSQTIDNIYFVFFYNKQHYDKPFEWKTLSELSAYKIGATRGYTYSKEFWDLHKQDKLRLSISNSDIDSLGKLIRGKIDLFPISEFTGKYLLHRNFSKTEIELLSISTKPLSDGKNYILFPKILAKSKDYLKLLNSGLTTLKQQGKFKQFQEDMFK